MKSLQVDDTFALVSDEDYEFLSKFKWHLNPSGYAYITIPMHRLIMQPLRENVVDHLDHNRLNNTRENLRVCSVEQNSQRQRRKQKPKSPYRGVTKQSESNHYKAQIAGRHIGTFPTAEIAAHAYDLWADFLYGAHAALNFQKAIN